MCLLPSNIIVKSEVYQHLLFYSTQPHMNILLLNCYEKKQTLSILNCLKPNGVDHVSYKL